MKIITDHTGTIAAIANEVAEREGVLWAGGCGYALYGQQVHQVELPSYAQVGRTRYLDGKFEDIISAEQLQTAAQIITLYASTNTAEGTIDDLEAFKILLGGAS